MISDGNRGCNGNLRRKKVKKYWHVTSNGNTSITVHHVRISLVLILTVIEKCMRNISFIFSSCILILMIAHFSCYVLFNLSRPLRDMGALFCSTVLLYLGVSTPASSTCFHSSLLCVWTCAKVCAVSQRAANCSSVCKNVCMCVSERGRETTMKVCVGLSENSSELNQLTGAMKSSIQSSLASQLEHYTDIHANIHKAWHIYTPPHPPPTLLHPLWSVKPSQSSIPHGPYTESSSVSHQSTSLWQWPKFLLGVCVCMHV